MDEISILTKIEQEYSDKLGFPQAAIYIFPFYLYETMGKIHIGNKYFLIEKLHS